MIGRFIKPRDVATVVLDSPLKTTDAARHQATGMNTTRTLIGDHVWIKQLAVRGYLINLQAITMLVIRSDLAAGLMINYSAVQRYTVMSTDNVAGQLPHVSTRALNIPRRIHQLFVDSISFNDIA